MKKSLLALAVLGAFAGAAQAQSSVTIYGIVDTGVTYTSEAISLAKDGTDGSKFALNSGILQGSRIGFKGVEDLGGGLNAVFNLETGFKSDTGANDSINGALFRRKSVIGLSGGFGTVLVGRQTDFADTLNAMTSVADFGGIVGAVGHNLDRLEGTRTQNSISYTTTNMDGLTANVIYGFGEQAGQKSAGQAFGIGAKYENAGLGLGANFYQSKHGITPADTSLINNDTTDTAAKVINIVASYQLGAARVYGNWSRVKQDQNSKVQPVTSTLAASNKADIYEVGTAYTLNPSLKLLASVQHTRADVTGYSKGKLTQFNLGTDYWLSKRTDVYAFVSHAHASNIANSGVFETPGSDAGQTALAVGVRHKF